MKTPSKLDQARAMREARYGVSTEAIDKQMVREGMPTLIAPAGECPYCDARRAANAMAQKKWRQSK